jgi:carboxypeptidase Q
MEARMLPDADSRNVMAEIVGSEHPEEVVVMGGHIDSWDVGQGAMDDGGGLVAAWEAVRLIQRLGLKPKRTIRVVGWTNEENGTRGGTTYLDSLGAHVADHVLAIESDGGVFQPWGFDFVGSDSAYAIIRQVASLLTPSQADSIERGAERRTSGRSWSGAYRAWGCESTTSATSGITTPRATRSTSWTPPNSPAASRSWP